MDPTSLISAFIGAQTGMFQLAVAARLARLDQQSGAYVAATIGTNLDVST